MGKFCFLRKMAKSKNHTSHNQGYKNHRNGIFKPKRERYSSHKMVNQKLNRNTRRARRFDPSIKKSVNYTKKIANRVQLKQTVLDKLKQVRLFKLSPAAAKLRKEQKEKRIAKRLASKK